MTFRRPGHNRARPTYDEPFTDFDHVPAFRTDRFRQEALLYSRGFSTVNGGRTWRRTWQNITRILDFDAALAIAERERGCLSAQNAALRLRNDELEEYAKWVRARVLHRKDSLAKEINERSRKVLEPVWGKLGRPEKPR